MAAVLLFDRSLRVGETRLLEYELRIEHPAIGLDHRRAFRYPADLATRDVPRGTLGIAWEWD